MQASGLEQDRYAIKTNDGVDLPAIKRDDVVAGVLFDIRARHKRNALPESLPRPVQHLFLFRIAQVVHVAGVHVDGVHQPNSMRGDQLLRKRVDGDSAIWLVTATSAAAMPCTLRRGFWRSSQIVNRHSSISTIGFVPDSRQRFLASFNFSAMSDSL